MRQNLFLRGQILLSVLLLGGLIAWLTAPAVTAGPATVSPSGALQLAFHNAAGEFGVPEAVLLSVSYHVSLWEDHGGMPSAAGGYGPMHLTHVDRISDVNARGDAIARSVKGDPSLHTLDQAARLLHLPIGVLERDPIQNIRGGAALLARYAIHTTRKRPAAIAGWYGAVAEYSDSADAGPALEFADAVYRTIDRGMTRMTSYGQLVRLSPLRVTPDVQTARSLHLHLAPQQKAQCPPELDCRFVPAAYQVNNPNNPEDYGNYDAANRPKQGPAIRYVVIHDTEGSYQSAISSFQNPVRYASANYVIRSSDGQVTQMVPDEDIAWHAGDYYVNMHSIGIEHEGVAIQGATWYNEQLYESSAALVSYLAATYKIPLDRAHIFGHDQVPGLTPQTETAQHWDPGLYWDWQHYMDLLGASLPTQSDGNGPILTVNPPFATNLQPATYCTSSTSCGSVPTQPANFVYLRTAPDTNAPLLGDPALHPAGSPGTTKADDWGDKAVTGQQFVRVDRQGDWDAIDYGGQKAWLYDPAGAPTMVTGTGRIVTPRKGRAAIPVYGMAYPEKSAYPRSVKNPPKIVPLQYTIKAGQQYVTTGLVNSDYYWSPTQTRHILVKGHTKYYQIFFNHRIAFVRFSDVTVQTVRT